MAQNLDARPRRRLTFPFKFFFFGEEKIQLYYRGVWCEENLLITHSGILFKLRQSSESKTYSKECRMNFLTKIIVHLLLTSFHFIGSVKSYI